eukprot:Rmarinus@m.7745
MGLGLDLTNIGTSEEHGFESEDQLKLSRLNKARRECSMIRNNVFVGGHEVAESREILDNSGITHIVNVAGMVCRNYHGNLYKYLTLYLLDDRSEDLFSVLYDIFEWMEDALSNPKNKVFVHCWQGVSRSCAVVIAYLMWKEGMAFRTAFDDVKRRRIIADPTMGFVFQLIDWEKRKRDGAVESRIVRIQQHADETPGYIVGRLVETRSSALREFPPYPSSLKRGLRPRVFILAPKCVENVTREAIEEDPREKLASPENNSMEIDERSSSDPELSARESRGCGKRMDDVGSQLYVWCESRHATSFRKHLEHAEPTQGSSCENKNMCVQLSAQTPSLACQNDNTSDETTPTPVSASRSSQNPLSLRTNSPTQECFANGTISTFEMDSDPPAKDDDVNHLLNAYALAVRRVIRLWGQYEGTPHSWMDVVEGEEPAEFWTALGDEPLSSRMSVSSTESEDEVAPPPETSLYSQYRRIEVDPLAPGNVEPAHYRRPSSTSTHDNDEDDAASLSSISSDDGLLQPCYNAQDESDSEDDSCIPVHVSPAYPKATALPSLKLSTIAAGSGTHQPPCTARLGSASEPAPCAPALGSQTARLGMVPSLSLAKPLVSLSSLSDASSELAKTRDSVTGTQPCVPSLPLRTLPKPDNPSSACLVPSSTEQVCPPPTLEGVVASTPSSQEWSGPSLSPTEEGTARRRGSSPTVTARVANEAALAQSIPSDVDSSGSYENDVPGADVGDYVTCEVGSPASDTGEGLSLSAVLAGRETSRPCAVVASGLPSSSRRSPVSFASAAVASIHESSASPPTTARGPSLPNLSLRLPPVRKSTESPPNVQSSETRCSVSDSC